MTNKKRQPKKPQERFEPSALPDPNAAPSRIDEHRHTGKDVSRISFLDLDTVLYKEVTINPGNLSDGVGETISVTVKKASLGDFVMVAAPYDLQDVTVTGYVQAADTVEIRIQNESTGSRDLASGVWKVLVIKTR